MIRYFISFFFVYSNKDKIIDNFKKPPKTYKNSDIEIYFEKFTLLARKPYISNFIKIITDDIAIKVISQKV